MKLNKFLAVFLTVALLVCAMPTGVFNLTANAAIDGYFTYTVSNGEATITRCNASISGDVEIPSTLGGYPVTSIGDFAFYNCSSLKSITIPDSVTSIGDFAFHNCSSLTSITIPDSVTSIGDSAFYDCSSLTLITIPDNVTSIGSYTFSFCDSLTSITIPDSVTSIGEDAFYYCSSLTSITIPDSVTSIGEDAFSFCDSLTSVTIGNSVTSIGDSAFSRCSSLTSITIPDSVTSIGDSAFYYCHSLTSITIPDSVTSIGSYTFFDCSLLENVYISDISKWCGIDFYDYNSNPLRYADNLYLNGNLITNLEIPQGVTTIPDYAFSCKNIVSVTIPDSVTSIGDYAFQSCSALTSITIPDSVTSIGIYAFRYCNSLEEITIKNPETLIGSNSIPTSATIYGYKDSTAEEYALDNGNEFIAFKPEINSVSITAGTDITVNYYSEYGANSTMKFTVNGEEFIVDGYYDAEINKYVYRFPNIAPDRLGDEIKAELITNGEVVAVKEGFTVKKYLDTILSKTAADFGMAEEDYAKLKTLAADLLHYGAAAQKYFGYKTSELVNDGVTEGTEFVAPTTTAKDVTNKSANGVTFAGQNLRFDSVNRLMFKFNVDTSVITDISKLTIKITVGDETKIVTSEDFEAAGANSYIVYTDEIFATEFDEVFTVTACVDGVEGANVKYSVNSYVYAICNSTTASEKMVELAKATYNYGLSAKAYLNK